jgi:hypothetical protein
MGVWFLQVYNQKLMRHDCAYYLMLYPKHFGIGGGPIIPGMGRKWINHAAFEMDDHFHELKKEALVKSPSPSI